MRCILIPSIFSTLVRKNFQKQRKNKLIFFLGLILPVVSAVVLSIFRYSHTPNTPDFTNKADDSLSFDSSWSSLKQKINVRRQRMLKAQENFYANVFIPNLRVAYAPSSHAGLQKLMEVAMGKLDISKNHTHGFIDCDLMRTRASFEQFIASVCFHSEDVDESKNGLPQVLHYSIIMPSELRVYDETIGQCWKLGTSHVVRQVSEPSTKIGDDGYTEYLQEGFIALQYYISSEYIQMASGSDSVKTPVMNLRALNGVKDVNPIFSGDAVTAIILMMVLGFMFPVTLLVKFIVKEHETGQRFVLEQNNVSRFVQVTAWFVNACVQLLITSTVLTLILKISWNGSSAPLGQCPVYILFFFLVSYSLSVGSFIILISAIIRSTKLALVIVPIIWFLVPFPFFFKEELKSDISNAFNVVASVFLCNVALSWGLTHLMDIENHPGTTPEVDVLTSSSDNHFELSLGAFIVFFYIQTLMYTLLTLIIQSRTMARIVVFLKAVSLLQYLRNCCRRRKRRRKFEAGLMPELQKEIKVLIEDSMPISSQYLGVQQNLGNNTEGEKKKTTSKRWFSSYWNSSSHKNPPPNDANTDRDIENDTETETEAQPERKGWSRGWISKYWSSSPPQKATIAPLIDSDTEIETREAGIEFRNVTKKYRKNLVIKRFSLKVFPGEVVVLLGHNSSGKMSVMKMLKGLTLPTRGAIYLSGVNTVQHGRHLNLKAYRKVGMSLTPSSLFHEFTVFDHLMFFCALRGLKKPEADREVRAFLRSMQMEDVQGTRVGNLSTGQRRIFQSLCGFVGRTEIVFLGRPLDGVDEARARLFYNFVQAEKRNRTIFVTTNRSSVASGLGDRIAILSKGNLVFLGTERKMCHELNDAYRLTFYGKAQCDFEKVRKFLETFTAAGVELDSKMGDSAAFLIKKQDVPQLTKALETLPSRKEELKIDSFHLQECNLDRLLIKHFTPELQHFALQAPEAEPSIYKTKWHSMKRFCLLFSHFKIVMRHRALIDIRGSFFLLVKVLLPTLMAIWIALCMPYLHSYRKLLEKSAFPVNGGDDSAVTLAQEGLSNDGRLKAAYNAYVAMGAKTVDADLDISNMRSDNNILSQEKILATAKFTESEVDAQFNKKWLSSAPHSLALAMNALAVGYVGADSGIKVELDPLPYSTVPAVRVNSEKYNITLLFISEVCFAFCFILTLPMLFMTLDRDSRLNYIELIAGMRTSVFLVAILVYELLVFVISFFALHLAIIVLRFDALMDVRGFLLYGNAIMVVAMCVLSINVLVSLGSADVHTAYLTVLAFHTLGIVVYIFVSELHVTGAKRVVLIFLDFYPLHSLMDNMMRIVHIMETKWLCMDVQIYETSVYAEECKIKPNCCDNNDKEYSHFRQIICIYLLSFVIWLLIYVRLKSQLYKSRPHQGKYFWDSDADSYHDQHVLHMAQPSDVENTWIYEKSRVRTLERSLIWMKTIHVEDLSVLFGVNVALNKVDFMVDRYQVLSLFGANGSGKTVMIKAILGIYSPSSGHVSGVNRIPYQRTKPAIGNLAGYSAQEVNMMQDLTVLETLKLVLRLRRPQQGRALRAEAILLCKILNLYQFRYHFLSSLSLGVLKRVSIGLALMTNAELILLDDPFANLDVITQHAVLQSIQDACRHGHCVIYTCSHTDFLAPAQRLAALGNHGFVAIGERQEITQNYYTSYYVIDTRVYLPEIEAMNAKVPTDEQDDPELQNSSRARRNYLKVSAFVENIFPDAIIKSVTYPSTCFWLSSQKYPLSQIFQAFERNKTTFYSYSIAQPSVGAIYLHITPEQADYNEFGY